MDIADGQRELERLYRSEPGFVGTGRTRNAKGERLILYINDRWQRPAPAGVSGYPVELKRMGTPRPLHGSERDSPDRRSHVDTRAEPI